MSNSLPVAESRIADGTIQGDVERLIKVAAQLFSLIEGKVHELEDELVTTFDENVRVSGRGVIKEELIQSAASLDSSLQEIRDHLGREDARFTKRRLFLSRQFSRPNLGVGESLEAS
ncbi:MAG TPA: hypothetical protein VND89_08290 [Acidimicrobiales bacterium]|nr:hypothetical protein [Acidimicrobiales bacterium]